MVSQVVKANLQIVKVLFIGESLYNLAPTPTIEIAIRISSPLECAWTNVETDAKSLVPAPSLELGAP